MRRAMLASGTAAVVASGAALLASASVDSAAGEIVRLDGLAIVWLQELRWEPLTLLFVLASAWWVKGLVFAGLGGLRDVAARRRVPVAALAGVAGFGLASLVTSLIKDSVERARPFQADPSVEALATPSGFSFPSAHTSTAFAAAMAVAIICPRLRWPLLGLAAVVGLSRMYLGVHYGIDVAAGAALGILLGALCGWVIKTTAEALPHRLVHAG